MLRDTWLIAQWNLRTSMRNPAWILIQILQPLLYLFLFGPLIVKVLGAAQHAPGGGWSTLTPALVVQLALFGSSFAGFGLLADYRIGVVERLRVTPTSRVALLLGRVVVNAIQAVIQSALLILIAFLVFGVHVGVLSVVLCLLVIGVLAGTLASASYALALTLKSEQTFPALLNAVTVPLMLLSGILIPINQYTAPGWLYAISRANPFVYIVEAQRAAFQGNLPGMLTGTIVLVVMAALTITWGTRVFRKENA